MGLKLAQTYVFAVFLLGILGLTTVVAQSGSPTALGFDGIDDYAELPTGEWPGPSNEFTIMSWIKLSGSAGNRTIFSKGTSLSIGISDKQGLTVQIGTASISIDESLGDNRWHHVALSFNGTLKLLVDGRFRAVLPNISLPPAGLENLILGSSGGTSRFFNGQIDELSLWDRVLDENTIRSSMYLRVGGNEDGLFAYYPLDVENGRILRDLSGKERHGIVYAHPLAYSDAVSAEMHPYRVLLNNKCYPAVYYNGQTYCAFLDDRSRIVVRSFSHAQNSWGSAVLLPSLTSSTSGHVAPDLTVIPSGPHRGKIVVSWSSDISRKVYAIRSKFPESISAWDSATWVYESAVGDIPNKAGLNATSDGTLFVTFNERVGGREAWPILHFAVSRDGGSTWKDSVLLSFAPTEFVHAISEVNGQVIHLAIEREFNQKPFSAAAYYMKSPDGGKSWQKADGTPISLPADFHALDEVTQAVTSEVVRIHDIMLVDDQPVFTGIRALSGYNGLSIYIARKNNQWVLEEVSGSNPLIQSPRQYCGAGFDPTDPKAIYTVIDSMGVQSLERWKRVESTGWKRDEVVFRDTTTGVRFFYPRRVRNGRRELKMVCIHANNYKSGDNQSNWGQSRIFAVLNDSIRWKAALTPVGSGKSAFAIIQNGFAGSITFQGSSFSYRTNNKKGTDSMFVTLFKGMPGGNRPANLLPYSWIIRNFGKGFISGSYEFHVPDDSLLLRTARINGIKLFTRNTQESTWKLIASASYKTAESVSFFVNANDLREEFAVSVIPGSTSDNSTIVTPGSTLLHQNFPNPFNPSTSIRYELFEAGRVSIRIYNVLGQEVKTLVDQSFRTPGLYQEMWDGRDNFGRSASAGVYVCRLSTNGQVVSRRMLLVK